MWNKKLGALKLDSPHWVGQGHWDGWEPEWADSALTIEGHHHGQSALEATPS